MVRLSVGLISSDITLDVAKATFNPLPWRWVFLWAKRFGLAWRNQLWRQVRNGRLHLATQANPGHGGSAFVPIKKCLNGLVVPATLRHEILPTDRLVQMRLDPQTERVKLRTLACKAAI